MRFVFAQCEHCDTYLTPGHIVQSMNIPQSSSYVAVILKCTLCRDNTKIVMDHKEFEAAKEKYDDYIGRFEEEMSAAQGEIMNLDSVAQLQELWSKGPPPRREATKGACKCDACIRKWYLE